MIIYQHILECVLHARNPLTSRIERLCPTGVSIPFEAAVDFWVANHWCSNKLPAFDAHLHSYRQLPDVGHLLRHQNDLRWVGADLSWLCNGSVCGGRLNGHIHQRGDDQQ